MFKLPENLQEIGDEAFEGCESLYGYFLFPSKVETVGKAAFAGTHLGEPEPTTEVSAESGQ